MNKFIAAAALSLTFIAPALADSGSAGFTVDTSIATSSSYSTTMPAEFGGRPAFAASLPLAGGPVALNQPQIDRHQVPASAFGGSTGF
jgi:hypothetical protein